MRIAIAGGTGFLGTKLGWELLRKGHEVLILTRQNPDSLKPTPFRLINWPVTSPADSELLQSCEVVINLAGESIGGKRWTTDQKSKIRNSRIRFTQELVDCLRSSIRLKVFLSSSAIGYYGDRKTEVLNEESPRGEGFLADVCAEWEAAAQTMARPGLRLAYLRTGIVWAREHGFLTEMEPLFQNWAGGPVGSGTQMLSWIHVHDWLRAVMFCIENSNLEGPINLVAPEPVSNKSFATIYGEMFGQPVAIPAPGFALQIVLGEMSALALDSQNVRPAKLQKCGFKFIFPYAKEALWDLYDFEKRNRRIDSYFTQTVWLPAPLEKVFSYFSDEKNLETITPATLNFHVLKKSTQEIMKGTLIDYKLRIHGLPVKWRTLIAEWDPPHQFADQQLMGPYSLWYHTHRFEALAGGTLMTDQVHYRLPLGGLGRLVAGTLVRGDVTKIFNFRKQKMNELFS